TTLRIGLLHRLDRLKHVVYFVQVYTHSLQISNRCLQLHHSTVKLDTKSGRFKQSPTTIYVPTAYSFRQTKSPIPFTSIAAGMFPRCCRRVLTTQFPLLRSTLAFSQAIISPNTRLTCSSSSPTIWCHNPGYIFNVLSLLEARRWSSSTHAGSHTRSSPPCEISSGRSTSSNLPCRSLHTLRSSSAVAARGLATLRRGLAIASFRFHSTLNETSGIVPRVGTTRQVGTTAATAKRRCSSGQGGLNLGLIPHMAPLRISPSHAPFCFCLSVMYRAMAPPRDSE
ncbi:unnamed protein product, partial [Linum tenue]